MASNTYILTMLGTDTKYSPEPHRYSMEILPEAGQAFPPTNRMQPFVIYVSVAEDGSLIKYSLLVPGKDGAMERADVGTVYHSHYSNGWADWISQMFRTQLNLMRDIYYRGDQVKFTVQNVTKNDGLHATIRACAASKGTRLLTAYPRGETLSALAKVIHQPQDRHNFNATKDYLPAAVIEGPETLGTDVGVKIKDGLLQLLYVIHTTSIKEFVIQGHSRGAVESLMLAHELEHVLKAISAVKNVFEMNQVWLNQFIQTIQCPYTKDALDEMNRTFQRSMSSNPLLTLLQGIKEKNQSINEIRVSIFALDPVAGNETLGLNKIAWKHDNMHRIPEIVREYVVMVQPNEHSRCFKGTVPANYNPETTKVIHLAGIGHHGTLSGNPLDQLGHFFKDDPNGELTKDAQSMALMELMEYLMQRHVHFNDAQLLDKHPLKSMIHNYVNEKNADSRRAMRLACYDVLIHHRGAYDRFNHTSYTGTEGNLDPFRLGQQHDRRLHFGSFADTTFSTAFGEKSAYFVNVNHAKLYLAQEINELKDIFDSCKNEAFLKKAEEVANGFANQDKFNDAIRMLKTSVAFTQKSVIADSQAAKERSVSDSDEAEDVMSVRDQSSAQFRSLFDQLQNAEEKPADLDTEHLKMLINDEQFQLSDGDKQEFGNKISLLIEHAAAAPSSESNLQDDEHKGVVTAGEPSQSEVVSLVQNAFSNDLVIDHCPESSVNGSDESRLTLVEKWSSNQLLGIAKPAGRTVRGHLFFNAATPLEQSSLIVPAVSLQSSQRDVLNLARGLEILQQAYHHGAIRCSLQDRGVFRLHVNNHYVDAHLIGSMVHIGGIQIPAHHFSDAYRFLESGRRLALTWRAPEDAPVIPVIDEDIAPEVEHLLNSSHFFDGLNPMVYALMGTAIGLTLAASGLFVPFGVGLIGFSLSAVIGCALGFALGYVVLGYASSHEQSVVVPLVSSASSHQESEDLNSEWQFVEETVPEDELYMDDVCESESNHSVRPT